MSEQKKLSATNWLMQEYGYSYSKQLSDLAACVQAYGDYVQQFDHDVARTALNDILKELSKITGMSREVGYMIQLRHLKTLLRKKVVQ